MKSRILPLLIASIFVLIAPLWTGAASGDTEASTGTTSVNTNALLLSGITVDDDTHIRMEFTQNIVVDSVRIRIAKQSDGTNIKVDSLTGITDMPQSILVNLADLLESGEAYTMTVISALSDKGVAITEGTDALSEFKAPDPLKKSIVVFDAAPNPTAVIAETPKNTETTEDKGVGSETPKVTTDTPLPIVEDSELPLTGMNPMIFLIISSLLALGLIFRKKA